MVNQELEKLEADHQREIEEMTAEANQCADLEESNREVVVGVRGHEPITACLEAVATNLS